MLTPLTTQILLALSSGEMNGYATIQLMKSDCGGAIIITDSASYRALKRMTSQKLIAISYHNQQSTNRYRITNRGRGKLRIELANYEKLARLIRCRLLI